MKKLISILLAIAIVLASFSLMTACGNNENAENVIKVGASITPHA